MAAEYRCCWEGKQGDSIWLSSPLSPPNTRWPFLGLCAFAQPVPLPETSPPPTLLWGLPTCLTQELPFQSIRQRRGHGGQEDVKLAVNYRGAEGEVPFPPEKEGSVPPVEEQSGGERVASRVEGKGDPIWLGGDFT